MKTIVVQIDLLDQPRAFLQDTSDDSCTKVDYENLNVAEKATWDAFQTLLETKAGIKQ